MNSNFSLAPGFHAVVIGGAGDIGAAISNQFCDLGASVTATGANEADLARTLLQPRAGLTLATLDITDDAAVTSFARQRQRCIHRGDVDDRTPGFGQQRAERHAGPERAGEIDVEHLGKSLDLIFLVACEDAGAIDQRIDAAVPLRECCDRGVVGNVKRRQLESGPRFDLCPCKVGIVDGGGGDRRAELAEQAADGGADIAGAADHDSMKALRQ